MYERIKVKVKVCRMLGMDVVPPKCIIIDDLGLGLLELEDDGLEKIVRLKGVKVDKHFAYFHITTVVVLSKKQLSQLFKVAMSGSHSRKAKLN